MLLDLNLKLFVWIDQKLLLSSIFYSSYNLKGSLLNFVPYVLSCLTASCPTCSCALRASCLTCLVSYVFSWLRASCLMCVRASRVSCPKYSRASRASCLRVLVPCMHLLYMLSCLTCLVSYVHFAVRVSCQTCLRCSCTSRVLCLVVLRLARTLPAILLLVPHLLQVFQVHTSYVF